MKKDDFNDEKLDIEIPYEAAEMLLNYAAETELSVEEILESAIRKYLEMMKNGWHSKEGYNRQSLFCIWACADFRDDFSENKENGCSNTDVLQDRLTQLSGKSAGKMRAVRYKTGSWVDAQLHAEVSAYVKEHGMTMSEFVSAALYNELHPKITENEEMKMEKTRTVAFQVPESLFQRIKEYLQRNNMTQKQFLLGLIEKELDREQTARDSEKADFEGESEHDEDVPENEENTTVSDFETVLNEGETEDSVSEDESEYEGEDIPFDEEYEEEAEDLTSDEEYEEENEDEGFVMTMWWKSSTE